MFSNNRRWSFPPPAPASGQYYMPFGVMSPATSSAGGLGTLRVCAFIVDETVTISRIGAEVTTIGDDGSAVRLGVYRDNGDSYPGALLVDAGTIAGDVAAHQEITLGTPVTLTPGVYWGGGALQAYTVTPPTVRVAAALQPVVPLSMGAAMPPAGAQGYGTFNTGVTGALPLTFTPGYGVAAVVPRLTFKVA